LAIRNSDTNLLLRKEVVTARDGSRFLLAVRAPGIGLNAFDTGDWIVLERRSTEAQITIFFERAKAFLGNRGEVVVISQRIEGRGVSSRIVFRHRASGAIGVQDFRQSSDTDRQIFWNCVDRSLRTASEAARRNAAQARSTVPARASTPSDWSWVRPLFKTLAWIGGVGAMGFLLTLPSVANGVFFVYQAFRYKYG